MKLNRRDFLVSSGIAATAAAALGLPSFAGPARPLRFIPPDKGYTPEQLAALRFRGQRRVYAGKQRFALGMPAGGICAGQVYLLGDGTLGGWHIDGRLNPTGYGDTSYRVRAPERNLRQGAAIECPGPDGKPNRVSLSDPDYGGPYDAIEFIGEYPCAEVRYRHSSSAGWAPPLDITLRAGSPFIPLNARDSALPCTILRYTLTNTGDGPVTGRLIAHLENGVEPDAPDDPPVIPRTRPLRRPGLVTSLLDVVAPSEPPGARSDRPLADFDSGSYAGWTVTGDAFGDVPPAGTFPTQQQVSGFEGPGLVNTYADNDDLLGTLLSDPFTIDRRYLVFHIGGGNHPGTACVNLEVDGKVVRTATGRNAEALEPRIWNISEFEGREARLRIVDAQKGPWGHVNADSFLLADRVPESLKRPRPDSLTFGSMAFSFVGSDAEPEPAGDARLTSLAAPFTLAPGQSREFTFLISWHFPNLHTGNGQMYTNWFADAAEIAKYVADNLPRLLADTELFRKTFYDDTTLPWWLATRLMMPTANLATGTAQWWKNGRFWGWEGVGCCHGTCAHVWNYSHAEARLFPELARTVRTMQDFGTGFEEATGRIAFRGEVNNGFAYAADAQSGAILKAYREHLCSADDSFLKANWPHIRKALDYQIEKAGGDAILEGSQHNTFDIDFVGPNTFVGSLYLASLLAGAAMAVLVGDDAAAARYRSLASEGREWTEANLFNGRYFVQTIPEGAADRFQYGPGCLSDQLFGQSWARLLDLGTVYDEAKVRTTLASIYRNNFVPALGDYAAKFPPQRVFGEGFEAGLLECTWPDGGRPGEPVLYRDEVWTGTEYQVAAGMLWEVRPESGGGRASSPTQVPASSADPLLDAALTIIKAIDDRYDGSRHNPWNEVECGDHYARAMAAWGAYQALSGFLYDGPAARIGMAPRLTPDDFSAFFSAAEGWGLLSQQRTATTQTNRIEVRWGRLRIAELIAELPPGAGWRLSSVTLDGHPLPASQGAGPRPTALLKDLGTLDARAVLEVTWTRA